MKTAFSNWVSRIAVAGLFSIVCALSAAAQDQNKKQPSDRTVDFLKTFVEGFLIPDEIPRSDGSKFKVNRSNEAEMKKFEIPREDMRRIIRIAYNGATAEICDRLDLQEASYVWMKRQEHAKNKWTEHQMFFISRLYLATVMWQTGSASFVDAEQGAEKVKTTPDKKAAPAKREEIVCTDARKKRVEKLEAFLKANSKS